MDPADLSRPVTDEDEEEDQEILFVPRSERAEESPPGPTTGQASSDCEIMNMVKTLNGAIASVSQDTARIRRAYDQLRADNITRDKALADLSAMVKEYGSPPATTRPYFPSSGLLYWMRIVTCAQRTSESPGQVMKRSFTASGWWDRVHRDHRGSDRQCRRRISRRGTTT